VNGRGCIGTVLWILRQSYTLYPALSEIASLVFVLQCVAWRPKNGCGGDYAAPVASQFFHNMPYVRHRNQQSEPIKLRWTLLKHERRPSCSYVTKVLIVTQCFLKSTYVAWCVACARSKMALLSLFLLSLAFNTASSARIAGFWLIGGSQYITMRQIMEELTSKGHEVLYASRVNSKHTAR